MGRRILDLLKGTIFHPQWMSDRFHLKSKMILKDLRDLVVVDIGSGNASYQELIHSSNTLYTIDYPTTNKKYRSQPNIFSDARCLPIADAQADVVLLFEVLEHVADTEKVMREIARILRPGGAFYLSVPFLYPIHDAPNDFWRFTVYGVTEILQKNNLEATKLVVHGNTFGVALQMINLGLLEICRDNFRRNKIIGFLSSLLVYPVTLLINILAWPLFYLPLGKSGNFGCFLIARHKEN